MRKPEKRVVEHAVASTEDESLARSSALQNNGMLSDQAWKEVGRSLSLSPRELEITRHIFADHTESSIACELGISAHTVRTHTERIYRKVQVRSRVELVVRVVEQYLRLTTDKSNPLPPICAHHTGGRCPLSS